MGTFEEMTITSLEKKVVKSGAWVFSARIVQQIFSLTRTIVLARLLSPNDFGLFGIALLTLSTLDTFSQTGFRQALIQKKEDIKLYLDTAWTTGIIRSFLIAVTLFFVAPYAALFFNTSQVEPILKVIGLAIILQSLTNITVVYFEKELKFNKYFAYQVIGSIADLTVSISALFFLRSVWVLVLGRLAGNFTRCIVSYIIDPYRPRFQLDFSKARELFGFGRWVLGSGILIFLITHGDDIFVGKLLGVTALGFYQMAYLISNLPATEITHVISQVTFPAYSKLQDNIARLRKAFLKVLQLTSLFSIPLAGGIFILAPEFTRAFLGEKWLPMVPTMQLLCLFGVMRSVGAAFGPVYRAIAKVNIPAKISATQLIFLAAIIYPLTSYWGIFGTAAAITLSVLVALCLTSKKIMGVLDINFVSLFKPVSLSALAGIGMILTILLLKTYVIKTASYISVLSLTAIGAICYLGLVFVIDKALGYDLMASIKMFRRALTKG